MRQYIGLIHKDADSDYGVSFPDLPGCVTAGSSLEEARFMAQEALTLHYEGMLEDGESPPSPSTLDEIMAGRDNRDSIAILALAPDVATKAVRINVTFPEDALAAIDRFANSHGQTRSGFLLKAARLALSADEAGTSPSQSAAAQAAPIPTGRLKRQHTFRPSPHKR